MKPEHPTTQQIPSLRQLWQEAFGDGDAFLDLFYSTAFSPDRCLCVQENDRVAAALYWMDCRLEAKPVAYLYAVATGKAFRRRGICKALMDQARQTLAHLGYAGILLVPGTDDLRQMYASMGYENATTVDMFTQASGSQPIPLRSVTPAEYHRLRLDYLPQGSVLQESCPGFLEGCCSLYTGEGCLVAAAVSNDSLLCQEFLGDTALAPAVLAALGLQSGRFRTPGGNTPFAMWLPLSNSLPPKYFAFAFD